MDKVAAHPIRKGGVHMALTETNREELIPRSAAGEITWRALSPRGSPGAPTEGSKAEPHRGDHEVIREAMPRQGH
jgi:hypothetical protein